MLRLVLGETNASPRISEVCKLWDHTVVANLQFKASDDFLSLKNLVPLLTVPLLEKEELDIKFIDQLTETSNSR